MTDHDHVPPKALAAAVHDVVEEWPDDKWRGVPLADVLGVALGAVFAASAPAPSFEDMAKALAYAANTPRYGDPGEDGRWRLILEDPANLANAWRHAAGRVGPEEVAQLRGYVTAMEEAHRSGPIADHRDLE